MSSSSGKRKLSSSWNSISVGHAQSVFAQAVLNTQPRAKEKSAFSASEAAARHNQKRKRPVEPVETHKGLPQTLLCRECQSEVRLENASSTAQCQKCKNCVLTVPKRDSSGFFRTGRFPF